MIQTLEKNVDKDGETLAAMISTCMKLLLLLSFQTFPKCNLRAFLTKAETSCKSVVALTSKVQNVYLNFKFQGSLGRNDYISIRKGSEEERFQSILIRFSLQIVCFTDILFDCLHLPGAQTLNI